jgi:hypothetical protein
MRGKCGTHMIECDEAWGLVGRLLTLNSSVLAELTYLINGAKLLEVIFTGFDDLSGA